VSASLIYREEIEDTPLKALCRRRGADGNMKYRDFRLSLGLLVFVSFGCNSVSKDGSESGLERDPEDKYVGLE